MRSHRLTLERPTSAPQTPAQRRSAMSLGGEDAGVEVRGEGGEADSLHGIPRKNGCRAEQRPMESSCTAAQSPTNVPWLGWTDRGVVVSGSTLVVY